MFGRAYEPNRILHKKGKRSFPKEVVKEVNSGEDLFTALYSRNIREIKQKAKGKAQTKQNGKSSGNIIKSHGLAVIHETNDYVEYPSSVDSFDELLMAPCYQPPKHGSRSEQTSKPQSIVKHASPPQNIVKQALKPQNVNDCKISLREKHYSIVMNDKENVPDIHCEVPPHDIVKEDKGKTASITLKNRNSLQIKKGQKPVIANKPTIQDSNINLVYQPSENESSSKHVSSLCKVHESILDKSKISVRKKLSSVLVKNKENIPSTHCVKSPDDVVHSLHSKEEKRKITSEALKNKRMMQVKDDHKPVARIRRNKIKGISSGQPNLNDSYTDFIYEDSCDEHIIEETSQTFQRLFPKSFTVLTCESSKQNSSDVICSSGMSSTGRSDAANNRERPIATELLPASSTPVHQIKRGKKVTHQWSPVAPMLAHCFKKLEQEGNQDEEKGNIIHEVCSDDSTLSAISHFGDLCLNSASREDKSQMVHQISATNSVSECEVTVDNLYKNSDKIVAHPYILDSPDPFKETIISDVKKNNGIHDESGQYMGAQKECSVCSNSNETPHVLLEASETSVLNTTAVSDCQDVLASLYISQPIQRSSDNNRRLFGDHLYDQHCTTFSNALLKENCNGSNENNNQHSFISSNVNCSVYDNGSKNGHCQKLSRVAFDGRSMMESNIPKRPSASNCAFTSRRSHVVVPLESYVVNGQRCNSGFRDIYIGSTAPPHSIMRESGILENVIPGVSNEVEMSLKKAVLQRCGQTKILSFAEAFPESFLTNCKKIGEGVYGEVFSSEQPGEMPTVLKIMPIEGDCQINSEPQKSFEEILSEIVITMELSNLKENEDFCTSNFPELIVCWCVQGAYPSRLLTLWHEYDEKETSENDSPEILPEDQIYIILELANVGSAMECYIFNSAEQSLSAFTQVTFTLAVAEAALEFEHRDLHWGNILIKPTKKKKIVYKLNGEEHDVQSHGIQASVIDFTLSRMTYDGCCIYNNLADDPALFKGEGDYQFDIYRLMQDQTQNNWQVFDAYNNVLWLNYVLLKLITGVHYRNKSSKIHNRGMVKLKELRNRIMDFKSAQDVALSFSQRKRVK